MENKETPAEKTEKKTETATGTKAPKQGREKNGRFASKKPPKDDGTVTIKVSKTKNPKKPSQPAKDKADNIVDYGTYYICYGVSPKWKIEQAPSEDYEGKIEISGKTYYSEKAVAQMISKAIAICASTAAKEVAKVKDEYSKDRPECPQACTPESDKQYEKSIRASKVRRISQKIASVVANMMLGAFCVGLCSAAVFGLLQLGHLIFAK